MAAIKRYLRALGAITVGASMMTVMAGCKSVSSGTGQGSGALPTVTIGYENAPDPEAVAIEQGFFQKYMHARVVTKYFSSGPNALSALASGSLNFMTTLGNPPTASAIARGVPLKVIWAMERYTTAEGLVVKKGSHIHSLAGLEGKTVALVAGSTSPFELDTALKAAHIPVSRVTQENMAPAQMVAAWKTGQIQAAYVWVPFMSQMAQAGGRTLLYDQNVVSQAPIFNLAVVNSPWAAAHPALVRGFIRAEQAGVAFLKSHPRTAYQDMGKLNGISASQAKAQAAGLSFTSLSQEVGSRRLGQGRAVATSLVTRSLASAARWLQQSGTISRAPANMSQYVDPSYCEQVLRAGK